MRRCDSMRGVAAHDGIRHHIRCTALVWLRFPHVTHHVHVAKVRRNGCLCAWCVPCGGLLYEQAHFSNRWARLAQDLAGDCRAGLLPAESMSLVSAGSWGGLEMLDPRVHRFMTLHPVLEAVRILLGPELTANGDFYFRPAVSDMVVDWGLEYHQDSFNYGGDITARPVTPQLVRGLQVLTVWLPLVPVDHQSGALSLVRGSHRRGKIWPATIAKEDREPCRPTTFADLLPRGSIAEQQQAAVSGEPPPYTSPNWPEGVATYGDLVAPSLEPGDMLAFHNMLMHGTSPHLQPDRVRWSIDLRYMSSSQGYSWHKLGSKFPRAFPCFVAATEQDGQHLDSYDEWQRKWQQAAKL
jgi:hypothetical protein